MILINQIFNYLQKKNQSSSVVINFNEKSELFATDYQDFLVSAVDYISHEFLQKTRAKFSQNSNIEKNFFSQRVAIIPNYQLQSFFDLINLNDQNTDINLIDADFSKRCAKKVDNDNNNNDMRFFELIKCYHVWFVQEDMADLVIKSKDFYHKFLANKLLIKVKNIKKAWCYTLSIFYHHPSKNLKIIGVTGTNGKSSSVLMMHYMLSRMGVNNIALGGFGCEYALSLDCLKKETKTFINNHSQLLEVIKNQDPNNVNETFYRYKLNKKGFGKYLDIAGHTTFDPDVFFSVLSFLKKTYDNNQDNVLYKDKDKNNNDKDKDDHFRSTYLILEMSSHGLDQDKLAAICFDHILFVGFSGDDHINYHKSKLNYFLAKAKIFKPPYCHKNTKIYFGNGILEMFKGLLSDQKHLSTAHEKLTVSENEKITKNFWTNYQIEWLISRSIVIDNQLNLKLIFDKQKSCYQLVNKSIYKNPISFDPPYVSALMNENFLKAYFIICNLRPNYDQFTLFKKYNFCNLPKVAGRVEVILESLQLLVLVDYAHTPDGLFKLLAGLKSWYKDHEMWLVMGCGGDRDHTKRALMGKVAKKFCQRIFLTSDNPRSESPIKIIDEIYQGLKNAHKDQSIYKGVDRKKAISDAISQVFLYIKSSKNTDLDASKLKKVVLVIAGKGDEDYILQKNNKRSYHHDKTFCINLIKKEFSDLKKFIV